MKLAEALLLRADLKKKLACCANALAVMPCRRKAKAQGKRSKTCWPKSLRPAGAAIAGAPIIAANESASCPMAACLPMYRAARHADCTALLLISTIGATNKDVDRPASVRSNGCRRSAASLQKQADDLRAIFVKSMGGSGGQLADRHLKQF
jgi:hypothetical protein